MKSVRARKSTTTAENRAMVAAVCVCRLGILCNRVPKEMQKFSRRVLSAPPQEDRVEAKRGGSPLATRG